ncbi:MAG TPA: pitrilysin family protein, partial [Xanthomonadales bacterium]|nr:pitrilysin family protein [Xanthomonadales bacterium]
MRLKSPRQRRAGAISAQVLAFALWCWIMPVPAFAWLDLSAARIEHLDNGLTLIVLEDHSFPLVSVQALYRVGARNETAGATGLAHFLEHMAFRDSQNFPDSRLVSDIYAVGGEWHGYTWLDQTTYFATAPREHLDLLLRIEADRMARVTLSEADVVVERGAVITEMHSYENDPASVLNDHVMYLTFLAHPYRNNTIGWESDVARMSHADVLAFYQQHYHPGNAILAVVGDVRAREVIRQVRSYFGALPASSPTAAPHTIEPVQTGERRLVLRGEVERKHFKIAWRAPSASNADYPAFLLAQELLAGGSGVSFLQNDWGTVARRDAPLAGITDDLSTWFPPAAQDYVFVISGSAPRDADEAGVERAIAQAILRLHQQLSAGGELVQSRVEQARQRVRRELVFDVLTTEDAAHQLAFFAGLDALEVLLQLPQSLEQVNAEELARVIADYLRPEYRNIAWYVPLAEESAGLQAQYGSTAAPARAEQTQARKTPVTAAEISQSPPRPATGGMKQAAASPRLVRLGNGLPVMLHYSPLSPTVSLRVVTPLAQFPAGSSAHPHQPAWGLSSLDYDLLPDQLDTAIAQ